VILVFSSQKFVSYTQFFGTNASQIGREYIVLTLAMQVITYYKKS